MFCLQDNNDNVLAFVNSADTNVLDLSGAPAGTCRIWGWSYRGLADPIIGEPISQLTDDPCETISDNFITVTRLPAGNNNGVDLSLSVEVDNNLYEQFSNSTFTLTVCNDGTEAATNVIVESPFPNGLVYVSDHTTAGQFELAWQYWTIPSIAPGTCETLNLTLFSLVEDQNLTLFTQVISLDQVDLDSTPDNSDGQVNEDDEASVTITPRAFGGFGSNTGNLDLELTMTTQNSTYDIYEVVRYRIEVQNTGSETATGVTVSAGLPEGMVFTNANVNNGEYNLFFEEWTIDFIGAGQTATLDLDLFTLVQGQNITNYVEILTADQLDPDSTPGNFNGQINEDDEAAITLTFANNLAGQNAQSRTAMSKMMEVEQIYPNPAVDRILLPITSQIDIQTNVNIIDVNGRLVSTQPMKVFEGYNGLNIDINDLSEGVYFIKLEGIDITNNNNRFVKISN